MSYIVYMKLGDKIIKLNKNNNGENNMKNELNNNDNNKTEGSNTMNKKVIQMEYDVLKNTPILWKNEMVGINGLMERRFKVQQMIEKYPNGLDGVHNHLKGVNRFIISELKKQLDDRGLVLVEVELIGNNKDWRGEKWKSVKDKYKRFVCFVPKVVCGSKEDITFFICTLFRELNEKLSDDFLGYEYVQYLDWLKDVKIELKNPLKSEVLEPLFGTDKFIWINPNQMMTMKDFSSKRYCELYDSWYSKDEEYMKGISERDKELSEKYGDWNVMIGKYGDYKYSYDRDDMNKWFKDEMNIEVEESEDEE